MMSIGLRGTGLTDVGITRGHNEDSFHVDNNASLFVVADGVGGQNAGEVASRMSVEVISSHFSKSREDSVPFVGKPEESFSDETNRLASSIRLANQVVHESSRSNPSLKGMGSTAVAVTITGKGMLGIAHAGDSRAYLIRSGGIFQLTNDHSLVAEQVRQGLITEEEAQNSKVKNVITRALGAADEIEVDIDEQPLEDGDMVLLCSDGLTNMVDDETILKIIEDNATMEDACRRLIKLSNDNGGKDNITAVLVTAEKKGLFQRLLKMFK
jgi:protein phosphatase